MFDYNVNNNQKLNGYTESMIQGGLNTEESDSIWTAAADIRGGMTENIPKKPDTEEFKAHDEYIQKKITEWEKNNPEPELTNNDYVYMGIMGSPNMQKHAKWEEERNQYMQSVEEEYRYNNPEYKKQAEEYDELVKKKFKEEITRM